MISLFIYIDYDMQYIYLNSKEATMKLYFKKKTKFYYILIVLLIPYCLIFTAEKLNIKKFDTNLIVENFINKIKEYRLTKDEKKKLLDQINNLINNSKKNSIEIDNDKYKWFISKYNLECEIDFFKEIISKQIINCISSSNHIPYEINYQFSEESPLGKIFNEIIIKKNFGEKKQKLLLKYLSKGFFQAMGVKN